MNSTESWFIHHRWSDHLCIDENINLNWVVNYLILPTADECNNKWTFFYSPTANNCDHYYTKSMHYTFIFKNTLVGINESISRTIISFPSYVFFFSSRGENVKFLITNDTFHWVIKVLGHWIERKYVVNRDNIDSSSSQWINLLI